MNLCSVYKLTVLSVVLGALSVALFALAVSTDSWMRTREALYPTGMVDPELQANATIGVMWIRVWTGLWRFCLVAEAAPAFVNCMAVDYEVQGTGRGEMGGTTSFAIITVARKSVALTVSSLILSVIAFIFSVVGNIRKDAKTLVGGVFFILSGLALAVGMILYISAINDEVGYRVSTARDKGGFSYAYGWSFFTAGFGFLASEVAAVVTITLFLKRNAKLEDMARIIPGLEDKMTNEPDNSEQYFSTTAREDRHHLCLSERSDERCFHLCRGMHNLSVSA